MTGFRRKRKALWVQNKLVQWCLYMRQRVRFKRDSGSRFYREKIRGQREKDSVGSRKKMSIESTTPYFTSINFTRKKIVFFYVIKNFEKQNQVIGNLSMN